MYTELNEKIGIFRTVNLLGINNFELVGTGTLITFRTMNLLGIDNLITGGHFNQVLSVL